MRNLTAIALVLTVSGCCRVDGFLLFTAQGQVVDAEDGTPLSGVTVALVDIGVDPHWPSDRWATEVTDEAGGLYIHLETRFGGARLRRPGGPVLRKDIWVLKLSKEGYKSKRIRIEGSELPEDGVADLGVVRLEPEPRKNRESSAHK